MVYVLSASVIKDYTNKAYVTSNATKNPSWRKLWHKEIGHPSNAFQQCTGNDNEYGGGSRQCDVCMNAKQTNSSCTGNSIKEEQDHVVRSDIIEAAKPVSLWKARYILRFIVEWSRFAEMYMIQSHSPVDQWIEEFKTRLKRVTSVSVKRLHTK